MLCLTSIIRRNLMSFYPYRPPQRRLLVILNPYAGTGCATKLMSSVVGPILQETGIEYEVLITERQGHAHEIVQAEPHLAKR